MESESVEEAFLICKGALPFFPQDIIKALPNLLEKISLAKNARALKTEETDNFVTGNERERSKFAQYNKFNFEELK